MRLSTVQCSCPHSVNACELVHCGGNGRHVGQVGGEQSGTVVELKAISGGFSSPVEASHLPRDSSSVENSHIPTRAAGLEF